MIHQRLARAARPAPVAEQAAVASAFASDIRSVLDAARPFEATLVMLGEFAIVQLDAALREAAGRPHDAAWRSAFFALDDFARYHLRHTADTDASRSFGRLRKFLADNADLAEPLRDAPDRGERD